jgi:hypothetical protein
LKEDFYVCKSLIFIHLKKRELYFNKTILKNALSTEEMFDKNRFICLINNYLVDEKTPFKDLQSSIDKLSESSSDFQKSGWQNKEYNSTLMENLVIIDKMH